MDLGQQDVHTLLIQLNEALSLEAKFQPNLQLPSVTKETNEITTGIRDGSAHVLRCLKVWYDLPSEVLFVAINFVDRFLTKMKARPKHMACIAVSSFHLASKEVFLHQKKKEAEPGWVVPDSRDLVTISQCKCTLGDLARMENIISCKLGTEPSLLPITPLTFLQLFHKLFCAAVAAEHLRLASLYNLIVDESTLWLCLEIVACDASCANFRASEVALGLLYTQLKEGYSKLSPNMRHDSVSRNQVVRLIDFALELKKYCKIPDGSFACCHAAIESILAHYNAECQMPHRQRLVWKLSHRTLRYLRPTDKLTSLLPTIDELGQLQIPPRVRSGSESSDGSWELEKDDTIVAEWNTSLHTVDWIPDSTFTLQQ